MRQVHIGDVLAIAETKRLKLARREYLRELLVFKRQEPRPNRRIIKRDVAESAAMVVGYPKILLQKLCALGPTADDG